MIFNITVQVVLEHHRPHSYKIANLIKTVGFPGAQMVKKKKKSACNAGTSVQSLGREDPLVEVMATHPSILAWRIPIDRSLANYSPLGSKSQTRLKWLSTPLCPDCSTNQEFLCLSPTPWAFLFPEKQQCWIRPIYTLQWPLSVQMKERVTHLSFEINS